MLGEVLAYDDDYNVVGTLAAVPLYDHNGTPVGMLNLVAYEEAGGDMAAIRRVGFTDRDGNVTWARGSKVWPEWLGGAAHQFRVELEGEPGRKRIRALVHRTSGYRRERAAIEAVIARRLVDGANAGWVDLRDVVGGPDRPLNLDVDGLTIVKALPALTLDELPIADAAIPSVPPVPGS